MVVSEAHLDVIRNLEGFMVTLKRVATSAQWKADQKKSWEDQGRAV